MERALIIDGKAVTFKSNAAIVMFYKANFASDFFADILKLEKSIGADGKTINHDYFEMDLFYRMAWVYAKMADKSIPPLLEWLETFDEFPLEEVFTELKYLMEHTIIGKKK